MCIADELHRGVWTIQQDQTACLAGIGDMTGFDQDSFAPRTSSDIFSHRQMGASSPGPPKSRLRRSVAHVAYDGSSSTNHVSLLMRSDCYHQGSAP